MIIAYSDSAIWRLHLCVLAMSIALLLIEVNLFADEPLTAADLVQWADLERIDEEGRQKIVREKFSLDNEHTHNFLARVVAGPMSSRERNGLTTILCSHGAKGLLWALTQMSQEKSIWTIRNLCSGLHAHRYREVYVMYVSLLADKRSLPDLPKDKREPGGEPSSWPSMPQGCGPMRVCDIAYLCLFRKLEREVELPFLLSRLRIVCETIQIPEREHSIAVMLRWRKEEGERMIAERVPSFIDDILKPRPTKADNIKEKDAEKD